MHVIALLVAMVTMVTMVTLVTGRFFDLLQPNSIINTTVPPSRREKFLVYFGPLLTPEIAQKRAEIATFSINYPVGNNQRTVTKSHP